MVFQTLLALTSLLLAAEAFANTDLKNTGRIAVVVVPAGDQEPWIARAHEQNIYREIASFSRVATVNFSEEDLKRCPNSIYVNCLYPLLTEKKIDAFMIGRADESRIKFEVYQVQPWSLVTSGRIPISRSSNLVKIRTQIFRAFRPFLEKGGIFDQRNFQPVEETKPELPKREESKGKSPETAAPTEPKSKLLKSGDYAVIRVFLILILIGIFGLTTFTSKGKSTKWSAMILLGLVVLLGLQFWQIANPPEKSPSRYDVFTTLSTTASVFGGMIWGVFLLINLRILFPSLAGVHRISQTVIFSYLRAWTYVGISRGVLLFFLYLPVLSLTFGIGSLFGLPDPILKTVVLPIAGLLTYFWLASLVESLTAHTDREQVTGPADETNRWHPKLKEYFIGYLKRLGVPMNRELIDRTLFLPGKNSGVHSYGGLFARPRIVIDQNVCRIALGGTPPKPKASMPNVLSKDGGFGYVLPPIVFDMKAARRKPISEKRFQSIIEKSDRDFEKTVPTELNPRDNVLHGFVLPDLQLEEDVPLISDNRQDLSIVEELLTDHRKRFDRFHDIHDYDVTNPDDKDFLFGVLIHQFGTVLRNDNIFNTFRLFALNTFNRSKIFDWVGKVYKRTFSRYPTIVADTFVALHSALPHFLQFLQYQNTKAESLLTHRGSTEELEAESVEIIKLVRRDLKAKTQGAFEATFHSRVVWLSQFTDEKLYETRDVALKKYLAYSGGLIVAGIITFFVMQSVRYHPHFLEMIEKEKEEIREAQEKAKEKQSNVRQKTKKR